MMTPSASFSKAKRYGFALLVATSSFQPFAAESRVIPNVEANSVPHSSSHALASFSDSYKAYQQAVADSNDADILRYSAQAYELGKLKFGDRNIDTANLGLNYASALIQEDKSLAKERALARQAQAHQLYLDALAVYELEYGEESVESIDPLLGAAQTHSDIKKAKSQFHLAVDIAEDSERPMLLASVQMSAFEGLKNTKYYTRTVRGYALNAFEIYQEKLPADAMTRVESTYTAGMIWLAEKNESKAIPLFEEVITQFSKLDYSHPYELASHARLVQLYETEGQSDKSTQHCLAIGSMKPWKETQEQTPLYRLAPKYPMSAARKGKEGWVQLAFTVDEYGFVTEPRILDSKGGSGFEKSSLKSLKNWRYAPKFIDGKAVAAESEVQMDFTLSKTRH